MIRTVPMYEVVQARVLAKIQERFDMSKLRRMPAALFRESARKQVEQYIELEAARLSPADRERLVEAVLIAAFGFGPLDELFADPTVREISVLGPDVILVRREQGFLPTNTRFRDEGQLHDILNKARGQGEPVGGVLPPSVFDTTLNNGFRVIAVIPPRETGQHPSAVFIRSIEVAAQVHPGFHQNGAGSAGSSTSATASVHGSAGPAGSVGSAGSASNGTRGSSGSGSYTGLPGLNPNTASGRIGHPGSRASSLRSPAPGEQVLERHRVKLMERLIAKLAAMGVYDLSRLPNVELRRIVEAYVTEYCKVERVYLSDPEQGRLTLEILTAMNR